MGKQFSFVPEDTRISDLQLLSDTSFVFTTTETIDPGNIGQLGSIRSGIYKIDFTGDITASWQSETTPPTGGLLRVIPLAGGDVMTYGVARKSITPFGSELIQPTMTRFDTNFNVVWTYNFGKITSSGSQRHLQKFTKTVDGNFVGVGKYFAKTGDEPSRGHGWIYKFSAEGDSIWGYSFPTPLLPDEVPNGGILYGVGVLSSGNIVAGGKAYDANNYYCWLVKITNDGCMDTLFCQTSALLSPTEKKLEDLSGYPNPANDEFVLVLGTKASGTVHIYDQYGRMAYRSGFYDNTQSLSIHTSHFNSGVYFVEVRAKGALPLRLKFLVHH